MYLVFTIYLYCLCHPLNSRGKYNVNKYLMKLILISRDSIFKIKGFIIIIFDVSVSHLVRFAYWDLRCKTNDSKWETDPKKSIKEDFILKSKFSFVWQCFCYNSNNKTKTNPKPIYKKGLNTKKKKLKIEV